MPCPLFEPRRKTETDGGRYPLIARFDGICHAGGDTADGILCNHGNAKGKCIHFPAELQTSAIRFAVSGKTARGLSVLVVDEENYWPRAWATFEFVAGEERLEPEIEDVCRRAQVFQFCRSYLEKF